MTTYASSAEKMVALDEADFSRSLRLLRSARETGIFAAVRLAMPVGTGRGVWGGMAAVGFGAGVETTVREVEEGSEEEALCSTTGAGTGDTVTGDTEDMREDCATSGAPAGAGSGGAIIWAATKGTGGGALAAAAAVSTAAEDVGAEDIGAGDGKGAISVVGAGMDAGGEGCSGLGAGVGAWCPGLPHQCRAHLFQEAIETERSSRDTSQTSVQEMLSFFTLTTTCRGFKGRVFGVGKTAEIFQQPVVKGPCASWVHDTMVPLQRVSTAETALRTASDFAASSGMSRVPEAGNAAQGPMWRIFGGRMEEKARSLEKRAELGRVTRYRNGFLAREGMP